MSTVVQLGLTIYGDVSSFGAAELTNLTNTLSTSLNCRHPTCVITVRASAGSVLLSITLTIPNDGPGNSSATVAAATAAASALVATNSSQLSSTLGVTVVGTSPVSVQTAISVPIVVAPPPPLPPLPYPPPPSPPPSPLPPSSPPPSPPSPPSPPPSPASGISTFGLIAIIVTSVVLILLGVAFLVCKRRSRPKAGAPSKSPDLESPSKSPYRLSSLMVDQASIVRAEFPVIVFENTRETEDEERSASAPLGSEQELQALRQELQTLRQELQALRQVLTSPPAAAEHGESPQDQMRRIEWIRHFVRLNELQKAYDLGWDGKAFQLTDPTNDGWPPSQPRTLPFTSPQVFSRSEIQRTVRDCNSAVVINIGTTAGIAKARAALDEAQADPARARRMMSGDDAAEYPALARARRSNAAAAEGTTPAALPAVAADVGAGVGGSSARQLERAARRSRDVSDVSDVSAVPTDFGGSSPKPPRPPRPPRNDCVDLPIFDGCGGRGRETRVVTDLRI